MLTTGFFLIVPPILIIFITLFLELHLSNSWNGFYFKRGIALFKKSIPLHHSPNLSSETLSMNFNKESVQPMAFKQMSIEEIAFTEEYESFRLTSITPVIHGLIQYKESNIEIIGLLNWFPIVSSIVIAAVGLGFIFETDIELEFKLSSLLFVLGPYMFFRDLYKDQKERYNKIFDVLLEQLGNKGNN